MKKQNLKKASFCLSSFLFWDEAKLPPQFTELNNDHKRMLEVIKASGLEYRAILPPVSFV
jgi:biliverdin reductase/flavin reductase